MKTAAMALIIMMTLCGCRSMRNGGRSNSPYVGQTFTTTFGMTYIRNIPRADKVPEKILLSSPTLWVAEQRLDTIRSHCGNCWSAGRLVTPLRVGYVPKGTRFKAIASYRIKHGGVYILLRNDFDMIILEDSKGVRSEVPDTFFKQRTWEDKTIVNSSRVVDNGLPAIVQNMKTKGFYEYSCRFAVDFQLEKFINDFKLGNEMSATKVTSVAGGMVLQFKTPTAFLTFVHFGGDWRVRCSFV